MRIWENIVLFYVTVFISEILISIPIISQFHSTYPNHSFNFDQYGKLINYDKNFHVFSNFVYGYLIIFSLVLSVVFILMNKQLVFDKFTADSSHNETSYDVSYLQFLLFLFFSIPIINEVLIFLVMGLFFATTYSYFLAFFSTYLWIGLIIGIIFMPIRAILNIKWAYKLPKLQVERNEKITKQIEVQRQQEEQQRIQALYEKYGTKDPFLLRKIQNGNFTSVEEYEKAKELGASTKSDYEGTIALGAPYYNWYVFLKKGGFQSYNEYLELKEKYGELKSKDDIELLKKTGSPTIQEAKRVKGGEFKDYETYLKAKEVGAKNNNQYEQVLNFKVDTYEKVTKILDGEFKDYLEAQKIGAKTKNEYRLVKQMNAPDYEMVYLLLVNGFPTWDIYVQAKDQGCETYKEYMIHESRLKIDSTIKTLFGQLQEGDEVSRYAASKIIQEDAEITYKPVLEDKNLYNTIIAEQLDTFLANNPEFEFIKLKNTIARKGDSLKNQHLLIHEEQIIVDDLYPCENCNNKITKESDYCNFCGIKIKKCMICKLPVKKDLITECPHCQNPFHTNHLREYIKVKGACPICATELKDNY